VIVHVTVWKGENVLSLPVGALLGTGEDWAVFTVKDGRERATIVTMGQRNNRVAQVLSGLSAGERVVLHPSDRIKDGTAISEREGR
jgi:HlyD family secretion protein